jgi:hypothetical protein
VEGAGLGRVGPRSPTPSPSLPLPSPLSIPSPSPPLPPPAARAATGWSSRPRFSSCRGPFFCSTTPTTSACRSRGRRRRRPGRRSGNARRGARGWGEDWRTTGRGAHIPPAPLPPCCPLRPPEAGCARARGSPLPQLLRPVVLCLCPLLRRRRWQRRRRRRRHCLPLKPACEKWSGSSRPCDEGWRRGRRVRRCLGPPQLHPRRQQRLLVLLLFLRPLCWRRGGTRREGPRPREVQRVLCRRQRGTRCVPGLHATTGREGRRRRRRRVRKRDY